MTALSMQEQDAIKRYPDVSEDERKELDKILRPKFRQIIDHRIKLKRIQDVFNNMPHKEEMIEASINRVLRRLARMRPDWRKGNMSSYFALSLGEYIFSMSYHLLKYPDAIPFGRQWLSFGDEDGCKLVLYNSLNNDKVTIRNCDNDQFVTMPKQTFIKMAQTMLESERFSNE